jgi:hypothetical protein
MVPLEFFVDIVLPAALGPWDRIKLLTEMSTRNISWGEGGEGGRWEGLTTLPPSCADCLEMWELQPLEPRGSVQGLLYIWVRKETL